MLNTQLLKKRKIVFGVILAFVIGCSGCATVDVPNVGEKGYAIQDDERRLIKRAQEACEFVDDTDQIYTNKALEEYLNKLARKLVPDTAALEQKNLAVKVLNDPSLNAFALPNGRLFVNIGALSATENEAQLATLFGHELTHVLNRHALKQFRSAQNKTAFFAIMDLPLGFAAGSIGMLLGQLGALSSIYGYTQQQELEADENGFEIIVRQGYDARESPKLFENLLKYIDQEDVKEPYFFSTHPNVKLRIKNFNDLLVQRHFEPHNRLIVNTPEFEQFAYEIYTVQIKLCLKRGMFKTAEQNFLNLKSRYSDRAETFYLGGEIYRLRQDPDKNSKKRDKSKDYPLALERYNDALKIDPNFAPALVSKGRVLEKLDQKGEARELFKKYLEVNPSAEDREYIEKFIKG